MKTLPSYDLPKTKAQKAINDSINEIYEENLKGIFGEGDPNHPKYNDGWNYVTCEYASLFGVSQREFMRKQYK